MKNKNIIVYMCLFVITAFIFIYNQQQHDIEIFHHVQHTNLLKEEIDTLNNVLNNIDEVYIPIQVEMTMYAPLDPQAVEGMCYSGNPNITASGAQSTPYTSIAMSSDVPFGTKVFIPEYGLGVVQDRGGMITKNKLDLMVASRQEALTFGRQNKIVYIKIK